MSKSDMALLDHLEKLNNFIKIAESNSINEAAKLSGVSQSGLSKSLSTLESVLGTQLFFRSATGLKLTGDGRLTLDFARAMHRQAIALEGRLHSSRAQKSPEQLRIGMYDSIAVYLYKKLARYLEAIYPTVRLHLFVDSSASLVRKFHEQSIDVVFGVNLHLLARNDEKISVLFEDQYSFYVAAHLAATQLDLPLMIHPKAADRDGNLIETLLRKDNSARLIHRIYNFESLKVLTGQGVAVGVLPTQVANTLLQQNILAPYKLLASSHFFGKHDICFMVSKELSTQYPAFTEEMAQLNKSHLMNLT